MESNPLKSLRNVQIELFALKKVKLCDQNVQIPSKTVKIQKTFLEHWKSLNKTEFPAKKSTPKILKKHFAIILTFSLYSQSDLYRFCKLKFLISRLFLKHFLCFQINSTNQYSCFLSVNGFFSFFWISWSNANPKKSVFDLGKVVVSCLVNYWCLDGEVFWSILKEFKL